PFGRDEEQLTAALGLYRQPVTGVHGTRDAGSVFTAWMMSPTGDSQSEAIHAILGWRQTLVQGLEFSVEGYRKWMNHLSVPEWGHLVQFTTHLSPAEGTVSGWDTRIDRKSTRLNSSHVSISYAVCCMKKKNEINA